LNKAIAQAVAGLPNSALVLMDARLIIHGGKISRGSHRSACDTKVEPVTVAMAAGYGTAVCACYQREVRRDH
jgi:hypothetical protein